MKVESSITGKRQTTIPKELYEQMGLKNTDKLVFSTNDKGEVVLSKKEINSLNICPVCNREVLKENIMVINDSQKYHEACWSIAKSEISKAEVISNRLSNTQIRTLDRVEKMNKNYLLEMTSELKDNEAIINVPIKVTFMEHKPGVIGMIRDFNVSRIMNCNEVE